MRGNLIVAVETWNVNKIQKLMRGNKFEYWWADEEMDQPVAVTTVDRWAEK